MPGPLRTFLRPNLDVLFVALNPPQQSANNGHWFSGKQSRFFRLLYLSGLLTEEVARANADERVFGDTSINFRGAALGVTDLVPEFVEVNSTKVKIAKAHMSILVDDIRNYAPRITCVIHGRVRSAFNRAASHRSDIVETIEVGRFSTPLSDCTTRFICNHFPNGNPIPDAVKLAVFRSVRDAI